LYATAAERAAGQAQGVNTPVELPRIGRVVAQLRGLSDEALAEATCANACAALPGLANLLASPPPKA
jgi:TatD DNase family protein